MSTCADPAAGWDAPVPGCEARAASQATAQAATHREAAARTDAEAVAGWDDPLPGYGMEAGQ